MIAQMNIAGGRWSLMLAALGMSCLNGWASAAPVGPTMPLYAGPAPGSEGATQREVRDVLMGEPRIRNVTRPTITFYPPRSGIGTGAAVIVAPGGGFLMLSIQSEGEQVARWLAAHGITAVLLKYRLAETPADGATFQHQVDELIKSARAGVHPDIDRSIAAQQAAADGLEAVRLVRRQASAHKIDPHRIGVLGFSAGGMVVMRVATQFDAASRPDFAGSIYGSMPEGQSIPDDAPPLFLAVAADDPLLAGASAPIFSAWRAKGLPAELHIFQKGDHGFGMNRHGNSSDHWIDEFYWWLQSQGLLKAVH